MGQGLRTVWAFARDVVSEFSKSKGSLFAAAMSYFWLVSLIPLLLFAIGVFGYVLGSQQAALEQVLSFAKQFIPTGVQDLELNLQSISRNSGLLGGLGLLGLLWTGMQVFVILQIVMGVALEAETNIGYVRARLRALGTVVIAGVLLALSLGLSALIALMRGLKFQVLGVTIDQLGALAGVLGTLLPYVISILAFTLVYRFLPTRPVDTRGAVVGGATAGILFELAKYVFRWYVTGFGKFNHVYGSVGGIIILVLWIYYVSIIAVIGAEVASVYHKRMGSVPRHD